MRVALGSDHGGYRVKEFAAEWLAGRGCEVENLGCSGAAPTDYPDFARRVAARVSEGGADEGLLVCTTGIGMSIAANRFPLVRAALCRSADDARIARQHNDANVLVLAGRDLSDERCREILDGWFSTPFSGEERHRRRVGKFSASDPAAAFSAVIGEDPELYAALADEARRQAATLNLIASENTASLAVRQAMASEMTNKYAEGYPGRRWYSGCENVDRAERLAIDRARSLFGAEHANVQPHCGSSANMAVYFAALEPGDTVLAMNLAHGGHLTHGSPVNFSGRLFHFVPYGVSRETERIDFGELARLARECRPKLIVAGASAYARTLEFDRFRELADSVGAALLVDMAHVAGLVAAGCHPSPVPYAEYVTSTTHKTLRGPRGGLILCRAAHAAAVDKQIFPGLQGGPLMHVIAAKAVCLREAQGEAFRAYGHRVVDNARAMAEEFLSLGVRLVSGGTDNHLVLLDVSSLGLTGRDAAAALDRSGIVVNKNSIPFDPQSPFVTSGVRIGTPGVTSRGMGADDMRAIARAIMDVLRHPGDAQVETRVRGWAAEAMARFPSA